MRNRYYFRSLTLLEIVEKKHLANTLSLSLSLSLSACVLHARTVVCVCRATRWQNSRRTKLPESTSVRSTNGLAVSNQKKSRRGRKKNLLRSQPIKVHFGTKTFPSTRVTSVQKSDLTNTKCTRDCPPLSINECVNLQTPYWQLHGFWKLRDDITSLSKAINWEIVAAAHCTEMNTRMCRIDFLFPKRYTNCNGVRTRMCPRVCASTQPWCFAAGALEIAMQLKFWY